MSTVETLEDGRTPHISDSQTLATDSSKELKLSPEEQQLLEGYHHLEQLRFESALLTAQGELSQVSSQLDSDDALEQQIERAERQVLEAKAAYSIRREVIENVLIAGPVLKAVHSGQDGSSIERTLDALIARRDELSTRHNNVFAELSSTKATLMAAEVELIRTNQHNAGLASTLSQLVEETRSRPEEDPKVMSALKKLRAEARNSRMKWRVMKSVVSATVAGSGLNWALDDELRDLVLDDEEDDQDESI
ncbi:MAG: hypothetical protein M1816_003573 [Peltula sp. TS41687]|nr:MAG: hypothetical protein M1816_003573 [Peltula sp. TS41687]